jgi:hypothetical protein
VRTVETSSTATTPRRWNETVEGIRWLPRLIDKARMAQRGTLGAYLFGHSPIDTGLLRRLGVTTKQFADIVAASPDDATVLHALRRHGFDEGRVERWSRRLPARHPWIISAIDRDERHVARGAWAPVFIAFSATEGFWMGLARLISRAP